MPVTCAVRSCKNNNISSDERFFSFPAIRKNSTGINKLLILRRVAQWQKACAVKAVSSSTKVCSRHFVKGKPADLADLNDVDWVPSLFLLDAHERTDSTSLRLNPAKLIEGHYFETGDTSDSDTPGDIPNLQDGLIRLADCWTKCDISEECDHEEIIPYQQSEISSDSITMPEATISGSEQSSLKTSHEENVCVKLETSWIEEAVQESEQPSLNTVYKENVCVQTETSWIQDAVQDTKHRNKLEQENLKLRQENENLRQKLTEAELATRYTVSSLEAEDKKCKYITGISSGVVLRQLYEALKDDLPMNEPVFKERMFVLALRKIRLNEPFQTLGLIYGTHQSVVSDRIFHVIHCIYPFLAGLVRWPPREVLKRHMPHTFRQKYNDRVTIILDCFEVPIETPRADQMIANANVYSFYKHHKTIKVLAGVTPDGSYSFISEAFGGRTSDKQITSMSGILDHIEEGDFVLADRGFLIEELLRQKKASISIPAFKKTNRQLEPLDACDSKELSALRIHVERMIGSLRQKMLILTDIIPITLLERWNSGMPALDQIIKIAAGIVNLCPSIVPQ